MASRTAPLLSVAGVRAAYVKKEILRGVSLEVARGEVVALLGGNGSGKSTLLKTIIGLLAPARGAICWEGRSVEGLAVRSRQQLGIGYLLQGGRVFPNLTADENLEIACAHRRKSLNERPPRLGEVFPALRSFGKVRAGLLSGGQKQMLAIEGVFAQRPELLLLDEPTGALSPGLAREILGATASYVSSQHCGALVVEQNVNEAKRVATRLLRLTEGQIAIVDGEIAGG